MDLKGKKALLIDDELDNRRVVEHIFMFNDIPLVALDSGVDCLERLRKERPDFILLDIKMPKVSGWEVIKMIRTDPELKNVPVIALTAHAMMGDEDRAFEAGFDGYLTKPITVVTLIPTIAEIVGEANKKRVAA